MLFLEHVPSRSLTSPVSNGVCIDVPESPMGRATASSIAVSAYLRGAGFKCVLPHVRICDLNRLALLSIAKAARAIGAWGLLITYGDPPAVGSCTGTFTSSIEAIEFVRGRISSPPRLGAVLSLRYPLPEVLARLRSLADFYLVLRLSEGTWDKFVKIAGKASTLGKILIPYVIVETETNRDVFTALDQPAVKMGELGHWVSRVCQVVSNVLLSLPEASRAEIVEAVETAKAWCFDVQKR